MPLFRVKTKIPRLAALARDDKWRNLTRRQCLTGIGTAGLGFAAAGLLSGCGGASLGGGTGSLGLDQTLLNTSAAAEAIGIVMYYQILKSALYTALAAHPADQAILVAAYEQEVNHYNQLVTFGSVAVPSGTKIYFPASAFSSNQATMNTVVGLKDIFVALYLISVLDFDTGGAKVFAGQMTGVESEQRALARLIAYDLGLTSVTGYSGVAEGVVPPAHAANNLAYERLFSTTLGNINQVGQALNAYYVSGSAGFGPTAYTFDSSVMTLPAGITAVTLDGTTPTS